jgi:choline kinase
MTDVLIVAAGRGSRLGPHTDDRPKCMVPFLGRPLLDWQTAALRGHRQIGAIHIVRGYRGGCLERTGHRLWDNPRWDETNMVHSMFCAAPVMESGRNLVVAYGDIVYEPRLVDALLASVSDIAVVVDRKWLDLWRLRSDDPLGDAESLKIEADGRISDIGRPAASLNEIEAQFIGLMRFSAGALRRIAAFWRSAGDRPSWALGRTRAKCYTTDLLRGLIEAGERVASVPVDGGWLEFDTGRDLETYERLAASGELGALFDPRAVAN